MFAYPCFALTRQQLKTENNKLNIYIQYLMKSTFETIWLFFHRPVGFVELLILYACVQIYTSDYRLISKTVKTEQIWTPTAICATVVLHRINYYFSQGKLELWSHNKLQLTQTLWKLKMRCFHQYQLKMTFNNLY